MHQHQEPKSNALARGPAKTDDIERVRHDTSKTAPNAVRVQRKLDEIEATTASLRHELEAVLATGDRVRSGRSTAE